MVRQSGEGQVKVKHLKSIPSLTLVDVNLVGTFFHAAISRYETIRI